jgi:hypothetical protein
MSALQTTTLPSPANSSPAASGTPTSPALSGPLRQWLLGEPSTEQAIKVVAGSPILRSEATMALPALKAFAMRPAGPDGVRSVVGPRFATFAPPNLSDGEWEAWWSDFEAVCGDITEERLEAGMLAYIRTGAQFLPKPGELRQHALASAPGKWERAYAIAGTAARQAHAETKPPPPSEKRPTREEMAEMMAGFKAQMEAKDPWANRKTAYRPTPCAKVDETGMSPEMRAKLEAEGRIRPRQEQGADQC